MLSCDIEEYIQSKAVLVQERLDTLVAEKKVPYNNLLAAARYSLLSGGKRLRPVLALATAEACGADIGQALDPACALEMVHTYSLIHDDLPCMDDDDFRRGKPSLHKAFPESHAILTGDFLLTFAFEVITKAPHLTAQQKIELISLLAKNAGAAGMIGGQVMDIEAEGKSIDIKFLQEMHERKTAALITTAFEFGGIIANVSPQHLDILSHFGREIGLAFQIIDDVIDVTSNKNSDVKNKKSTYVTLLGIEKARTEAYNYYNSALEKLKMLPYNTDLLAEIAELLVQRSK